MMAHLQVFFLVLCLAGCLAHSIAASRYTGLVHLEERVPSEQVYHIRGETRYNAFPTSNSHLTTLKARDLFEDDKQSDALARRDLVSHDRDKAVRYTGSAKQNAIAVSSKAQSDRNDIISGYSQAQRAVFRRNSNGLGNLKLQKPSSQNSKPKNANHNSNIHKTPHSTSHGGGVKGLRPSTLFGGKHCQGIRCYSINKGVSAIQEANTLFKRNAASNGHGPNYNAGIPVARKPPTGPGKLSSGGSQSKQQVSALQNLNLGSTIQKPRKSNNSLLLPGLGKVPAAKDRFRLLGERVAQHEVADLYKRGAAAKEFLVKRAGKSGVTTLSKPATHSGTAGRGKHRPLPNLHHGELRANFPLQGSDVYKRGPNPIGRIPLSSLRRGPGRPRSPSKELRSNFQLQGSDVYKRDPDANVRSSLSAYRPGFGRPKKEFRSNFQLQGSDVYKRDFNTGSELLQARFPSADEPELLLRRASKYPSKSHKPFRKPNKSGMTAHGSFQSLSQSSELYKRDLDDDESDYLTLLLKYLDLQNSPSNESEPDNKESEVMTMDHDSLEDLARSIQNLADGGVVDDKQLLEQRALSTRPAQKPAQRATTPKATQKATQKSAQKPAHRPKNPMGAFPQSLSGWIAGLKKPNKTQQQQPHRNPFSSSSSGSNSSKGGNGGMSAAQPVSGDEPY